MISNDVKHEQQSKKLKTNKSKISTPLRIKKSSKVTGRVSNPENPAATLSEVSSNIVNFNDSFKDLQSALIKTIYDDINEKLSSQLDTMDKTMKSVLDENKTLNEKISKLTDNNIPAKSSIKQPENDPLYKMSNEIRELRKEVEELSEVNQENTCQLAELQEAYKKQLTINTSLKKKITSQCETIDNFLLSNANTNTKNKTISPDVTSQPKQIVLCMIGDSMVKQTEVDRLMFACEDKYFRQ